MEEIKKVTTEELKKRYIALNVCMNYCVSVSDCEWEAMMAMELNRRGVEYAELKELIDKGIRTLDERFSTETKE